MAKLNIVDVIDRLDTEIRKALDATLREHVPNQDFNSRAVFKSVKNQVYEKWNELPGGWKRSVPDQEFPLRRIA